MKWVFIKFTRFVGMVFFLFDFFFKLLTGQVIFTRGVKPKFDKVHTFRTRKAKKGLKKNAYSKKKRYSIIAQPTDNLSTQIGLPTTKTYWQGKQVLKKKLNFLQQKYLTTKAIQIFCTN